MVVGGKDDEKSVSMPQFLGASRTDGEFTYVYLMLGQHHGQTHQFVSTVWDLLKAI